MSHYKSDNTKEAKKRDVVYTPDHVALTIIERYKPNGKVLDPCAGDKAFSRHIPNCIECEITEGKDFFEFQESVDWIIGNPPYSILNQWLEHSFKIAENIVYILPVAKVFGSRKRLLMIKKYGGIVEVYAPWTGRAIGFPFGWACGAIHFRKGHGEEMKFFV